MRISDWSSDVCSSDLQRRAAASGPSARQTQMCHADLKRIGVAFNPLPNRDRGGGCSTIGTVQLLDIGVPVTNLGAMRCGLARTFSAWARNAVAPAARPLLGSDLIKNETFGTYACRAGGDRKSAVEGRRG